MLHELQCWSRSVCGSDGLSTDQHLRNTKRVPWTDWMVYFHSPSDYMTVRHWPVKGLWPPDTADPEWKSSNLEHSEPVNTLPSVGGLFFPYVLVVCGLLLFTTEAGRPELQESWFSSFKITSQWKNTGDQFYFVLFTVAVRLVQLCNYRSLEFAYV